ncbi:MAG: hypothetical protein QUS14_13745 [Pyrinomonadaceae bacterium]|nr:hypothetical protein [Pyrinomonadaceae bacterium]
MSKILITTLISGLILASSCGSGGLNNSVVASGTPLPTPTPAVSATPGQTENECKICGTDLSGYKGSLKKDEIDGLLLALNDEYLAIATYTEVNRKFGDPRPFSNIVRAEERHAVMLKELFTKYQVPVPNNPWPGNVPTFASVSDACKASVQGEIVNRDLYTRLFKTTERADILDTYKYLQRASEENHLPAFERCGDGRGRGGRGPGNGRGPIGNR